MKLLTKLLLLAALLTGYAPASAQLVEWARLARNQGNNAGFAGGAAADAFGNTYVGFVFKDSARIGTQRLRAINGTHALIKYDSTGQVNWVKQLADVFLDSRGLAVDPSSGDVFVSGRFSSLPRWGAVPVAGGGQRNFYGKFSGSSGDLQWVNSLPRQFNVETQLAADGLGNVYVQSQIDSVVTIASQRLDSTNTFMAGARGDGSGQWVSLLRGVRAGGQFGINGRPYSGIYSGLGLAGRPGGGCMVYGQAIISLFYGTSPTPVLTTNPAAVLPFLVQLGPTGALVSARPALTAAVPVPSTVALAVDAAGNYYVTGNVNSSLGVGVAKYNAAGGLLWVTTQQPSQGGAAAAQGEKILVHPNGEVTIQAYTALVAGRSPTTIGTLVLRSENNLVHFNALGAPVWALGDGTGQLPYNPRDNSYCQVVSIGADARGNLYWMLESTTTSVTGPGGFSLTPPAARLGAFTLVGAGVITARVGTRYNTIRGRLYLDLNGNGLRDSSDAPFPQTLVLEATRGSLSSFSSMESSGDYSMFVGAGQYQLPAPVPPPHYAISQPASGSYAGIFPSYGGVDTARHFGIRPVANQADVRVTLTPYGAARPGFVVRYRLTLENVGSTVVSGTAAATLDARLSYVSSTPAGTRSGATVTWSYAGLPPFARREYDLLLSLPVNIPLGAVLSSSASAPLAGDVGPADNSSAAQQTVTGSFDPNDLTVNHSLLTPAQVAAGQALDYTIRFQNLGTDTAFTVVVQDTLNFSQLNLSSLQLVAQSHNCLWSLTGRGLLTVRFLNIRLPHRGVDVIRSQGFVRFRVLPQRSLVVGDVIPNRAHIYFDYNAPIRTNTTTTRVLTPTGLLNGRNAAAWTTYPNPAADALTLAATLSTGGTVRLELRDALGRALRQQSLTAPAGPLLHTLDLRGLAPGFYELRLSLPDGSSTSRRVVHE